MTTSTNSQQPKSSRKAVAFGVTAGVIGGSLAGMVLGVPGLTNAAADPAGVSAIAVQQTETETETETDIDTRDFELGDRLREELGTLVDDGTLTADQADAVTTHLVESGVDRFSRFDRGDRGNRGGRFGGRIGGSFERSGVVTDLLGIDTETLRDELQAGSTLAEVAEANGVSTDALIDVLVEEAGERLDTAVESERLTAEEAAEKLAELETKITDRINGD